MTSSHRPSVALARTLLPNPLVDQLDSAQLLTDDCVRRALTLLAQECGQMSLTGNVISDAHMQAAGMMYERASETLRTISARASYHRYAQDTDIVFGRVLVADQLAGRAGATLEMTQVLGHLRSPLSQNTELTEALERRTQAEGGGL